MDKIFDISASITSKITPDNSVEEINNIVVETCRKNKITLETLVQKLDKLSNAKKISIDKFGEEHVEDDNLTQHKSTISLLELMGYMKKGPLVSVEVGVSAEEREIIDMYGRWSN